MKPWSFLSEYKPEYFSSEWPTLAELFTITCKRYPDNNCFTVFNPQKKTLTYSEALERIQILANALHDLGVKKGDTVGVSGKNSPEWAIAYLATLFAGAVVVPVDYHLKSSEIKGLLKRAKVKVLFIDSEKHADFAKDKDFTVFSLAREKEDYIYDLTVPEKQRSIEKAEENDLAAILFTSGTTGKAKGVMLTHKNFVSDCFLAQANMAIYNTDIFYALTPLHHSYSMLAVFIEAISVGAEVIFAQSMAIGRILQELREGQVTMVLGIPLLFNKIIKGLMRGIKQKGVPAYGLVRVLMTFSGLVKKITGINIGKKLFPGILKKVSLDTNRICISGGGPLPASTFRMFNQLGIDFVQGYGLTETAPIVTLNPVEAYIETSVGKVIPHVDVKIDKPDEHGIGEILIKGPNVMPGYFEDEESTKAVMTEDGFFRSGDMGYLDKERYLYLTGRAKNIIVTEGGKNVYPEEIEDMFQLYDELKQILVRGYVLDEKMKTEGIEALIHPDHEYDDNITEERFKVIIDAVNKELQPYQRITKFTVVQEEMEMTTTRKIKRHAV